MLKQKNPLLLLVFPLLLSACFNSAPPVVEPAPRPLLPPTTESSDYNYAAIDQYALQAPAQLRQEVTQLADYLVKPARTEREKARAIFRWITANIDYDAENYFNGGQTLNNTAAVLSSGKALCDGYANLFKQLAERAGLESLMISGTTKGYAYHTRGELGLVDHAWNAVKIEGQWQLLDATWGAGYLDGRKKRFIQEFEPHYFLPAPSAFIFDHFPDDPRWQLLPHPQSKQAFSELAYLRPAFFQAGLELVSHPQESLQTSGHLTLVIRAPQGSYISTLLVEGEQYLDRNLVNLERKGDLYYLTPNFPHAGDYTLRIFAKRGVTAKTFNWALDYKIRKL